MMRTLMRSALFAAILLVCSMVAALAAAETPSSAESPLEQGFRQPPDSARPWVYWFWLNGNITREGITADLEAMRASASAAC